MPFDGFLGLSYTFGKFGEDEQTKTPATVTVHCDSQVFLLESMRPEQLESPSGHLPKAHSSVPFPFRHGKPCESKDVSYGGVQSPVLSPENYSCQTIIGL